jgi:hypothetical protein
MSCTPHAKKHDSCTPHAQLRDSQLAVLHELSQLNAPRVGIMEMAVDISLPSLTIPSRYTNQDICSLITQHKFSKALIYFDPKYTLDETGRDELLSDLIRAALAGGDRILSMGKGRSKDQCLDIRCQCSIVYRGSKVDKVTGDIIGRSDYRKTTYCNDRKNQRHGQKGFNGSHKTVISRRLTNTHEKCPFHFSVFMDAKGYYIKSKLGCVSHQSHHRRDHLRTSTSLLHASEAEILADLNTARAKIGTAVNLHFVRSGRLGTPTVLSSHQIRHLVNKSTSAEKDHGKENGEIDDIYQFLESTGNYYVSLLARGPTCGQDASTDPSGKATLYNETRIGPYTKQDDLDVACDEEEEMLKIVDDHRRELKIHDTQEMMVGIAYGMPYELEQFGLFHVSMHIDATSDSNKEERPLVTVTSKDSYGHIHQREKVRLNDWSDEDESESDSDQEETDTAKKKPVTAKPLGPKRCSLHSLERMFWKKSTSLLPMVTHRRSLSWRKRLSSTSPMFTDSDALGILLIGAGVKR